MAISTKLDELFSRHAGNIPIAYLRAVAYHESGFNPRNVNPKSNATGSFRSHPSRSPTSIVNTAPSTPWPT